MPELHSISEASRLYRISEKTLRNWIRDGLLTPQKKRVNGKLQYALDSAQLEEVMHERNMIAVPIRSTGEQSRMEQLEQRLDKAESAIDALRQRVTTLESERVTNPIASELIDAQEFRVLHNLSSTQLQGVVGSATHLAKADMHALWQRYHGVTRFQKCEKCPHE